MRGVITVVLLIAVFLRGWTQDIHFSQFWQSPFNLNPALAGQFDGSWRFVGNQRTQWRSVTKPFVTFGVSADAAQLTKYNLGGALSVYTDRAGDSGLSLTMINPGVSKKIMSQEDGLFDVVAGLMLGLTSMSIDYSQLSFDQQWNGFFYDPRSGTGESFDRDSRWYLNLHSGILVSKNLSDDRRWQAGLAVMNVSSPRQSFFDEKFVRLNPRINLHGSYFRRIDALWSIEPMFLLMRQMTFTELNLGSRVHYVVDESVYLPVSVYGGLFARARDAGNLVLGARVGYWDVGVSYDFNLSDLRVASNVRGGFEIGVIYIIPPKPSIKFIKKVCPDYN